MAIATTQRVRHVPAPAPAPAPDRRPLYAIILVALAVVVLFAWVVPRLGQSPATDDSLVVSSQALESGVETSQNGWEAIDDSDDARLASFPWVTGQVLDGDVYAVLSHFAERFDAEVESIDVASSWGWAYRPVRGEENGLSNHASGTAIDLNATAHPIGSTGTFSDDQVDRLRELLDEVAPVLAWGGDFERPDEMHIEVVGTPEQVAEVAARLAAG